MIPILAVLSSLFGLNITKGDDEALFCGDLGGSFETLGNTNFLLFEALTCYNFVYIN